MSLFLKKGRTENWGVVGVVLIFALAMLFVDK